MDEVQRMGVVCKRVTISFCCYATDAAMSLANSIQNPGSSLN
jgi:hypothetical protein